MITVITGTPGAGKTLYAISKLLMQLLGTFVSKTNDDGTVEQLPRVVYTNIRGLLIDHELIDDSATGGLRNWHEWAKPGAVIVYDEFQKAWPPRPNGSKVPDDIQALDTHRHMGVDFILITQNVMNVDRHVHGLGGRHLHVRRIANMKLAIVYEWDHVSRSLMFSKAVTKSPWRYDKNVFKLYRSAEVHTKVPRKMPGLVWFLGIAALGLSFLGPTVYARLQERSHPTKTTQEAKKPVQAPLVLPGASAPVLAASAPVLAAAAAPAVPEVAGCAVAKGICRCFDATAKRVDAPKGACSELADPAEVTLGAQVPDGYARRVDVDPHADRDVLAWLARRSGRVGSVDGAR